MAGTEKRPYRSVWQDFDDLMAEMESRFQSMLGGISSRGEEVRGRMMPSIRADFRVDVRDHEDEVIVVADLPGVEKESVNVRLLDPHHLEISSVRSGAAEEHVEDFYVRERTYGTMSRMVVLPVEVTDQNSAASFKNGVLEVRMRKAPTEVGTSIPIE
ncbi:heat-shock protein Hsp20 [Methanoculleus taiwanensis]|uniref:Heat-shock protein Hsp20 n=1 Tax=Methanoculleus taiwanensis TaxID=1550565 RepID=A0A498H2F2_9EURY|nr:Hsp20/alpha crystallin family protein [Methanoculleus taiwanensis]RXE57241.1 heat-shock protein Hsp20 [Methanoculleus taiwanensis]